MLTETAGTRFYRALLRALPPEFRSRREDEMVHTLQMCRRDGPGGLVGAAVFWFRILTDYLSLFVRSWTSVVMRRTIDRKNSRGSMLDSIGQDVRLALRMLRKSPGFTLVAVVTIAVGIGGSTATFSVINGALLRPLPYGEPEQLVAIFATGNNGPRVASSSNEMRNPTSPANFIDWKQYADFVEDMTAAQPWNPVLTGTETPNRLSGLKATAELFQLLKVSAALGRTFGASDVENPNVIVLGHGMWKSVFGGREEVIGSSVSLDGEPFVVIGVMPAGFRFPPFWAVEADMWVPLVFDAETGAPRRAAFLRVFGRLQEAVTLERAQSGMDLIATALEERYTWANEGIGVNVEYMSEPALSEVRPMVFAIAGAVGLLLLIACSNVANLLLSRASARHVELAVRSALGASRGRVARQWLTESLVLAMVGGGLGALLAWVSIGPLSILVTALMPVTAVIELDVRVLVFSFAVSLLAGTIFGTVPALQAASTQPAMALRSSKTVGGARRARVALITAEVALAIVMLVGAGLLTRTLRQLINHDPGFNTEGVVTMDLSFGSSASAEYSKRLTTYEVLLNEIRSIPGVEAAGLVNHLPVGSDIWRTPFNAVGGASVGEEGLAVMRVAGQGYDRAMGLRLLRGRWFNGTERTDSERVVIVNETLARSTWPSGEALGRRICLGSGEDCQIATVIGVYADAGQWVLRRDVSPEVYYPLAQDPTTWNTDISLVLATPLVSAGLLEAVRDRVRSIDPAVPITNVRSVERILSDQVNRERTSVILMVALASSALLLSAVGLYGVISYLTALRNREIGVRVALGAGRVQILRMVAWDGVVMAAPGMLLGVGGSLLLGRLVESLLWQVQPNDPLTITGVLVLLMGVLAVATLLPALRAARTDPAVVLREE